MEEKIYFDFIDRYQHAEMVVIGVGDEWDHLNTVNENEYHELLGFCHQYLEHKNFFIISSSQNREFQWDEINRRRIVQPLLFQKEGILESEKEQIEKQWDLYNKWLSATLNKKLLILELGEGFSNPNVFRWPFEKVTFINQKAEFFRVNQLLPQIPENIRERAHSVSSSSYDFLIGLKKLVLNKEM